MKTKLFGILLLMTIVLLTIHSCKKDEEETTTTPNNTTPVLNTARDSAVQDYNVNFVGSNISSTGWTGSTSGCIAGTCNTATDAAVIKRINYFRRLVGLNDNCVLETTKTTQEQEAALMMHANNSLSHTPPTTWLCYTAAGSTGAGSSNLSLGSNSTGSIWSFIRDDGTNNFAVGHRRWILHSLKQKFCYGSTTNAMALYVFFTDTNSIVPAFIAYPSKGYLPQQLIPSRWSLSIPLADFSAATVTMTGPSGNVSLSIVSSTDNGYGDNTIVWVPTGIDVTNTSDISYSVTVSGIANASQNSYSYTTTIIKP